MSATATTALASTTDEIAAASLIYLGDDEITAEAARVELDAARLTPNDVKVLAYVQRKLVALPRVDDVELEKLTDLLDRFLNSTQSARKRMYSHLYVMVGRVVHFSRTV